MSSNIIDPRDYSKNNYQKFQNIFVVVIFFLIGVCSIGLTYIWKLLDLNKRQSDQIQANINKNNDYENEILACIKSEPSGKKILNLIYSYKIMGLYSPLFKDQSVVETSINFNRVNIISDILTDNHPDYDFVVKKVTYNSKLSNEDKSKVLQSYYNLRVEDNFSKVKSEYYVSKRGYKFEKGYGTVNAGEMGQIAIYRILNLPDKYITISIRFGSPNIANFDPYNNADLVKILKLNFIVEKEKMLNDFIDTIDTKEY
jgi:hypothetical protein